MRQDIIQQMLDDPTMLDEMDYLYKTDTGRKMLFYYQVFCNLHINIALLSLLLQSKEVDEELLIDRRERQRRRRNSRNASINEKPKKSDGIIKLFLCWG